MKTAAARRLCRARSPWALPSAAEMRKGADGLEIPGVLWRRDPPGDALPLVLDSPHSGAIYPEDFAYCCPLPILRRAEDAYVDELYEAAPAHGATLIGALFPRRYTDGN